MVGDDGDTLIDDFAVDFKEYKAKYKNADHPNMTLEDYSLFPVEVVEGAPVAVEEEVGEDGALPEAAREVELGTGDGEEVD
ncbi:unnamed protein product [Microthlaspi erraticum]|uniref:Uncharacterized protein n=1 Tax=Microthlaspi erraticum TaxID=1685480 RepID=A0A6D2IKS4_9BRAS|nr:unnamed protein product [Microthlaspi erraticum]